MDLSTFLNLTYQSFVYYSIIKQLKVFIVAFVLPVNFLFMNWKEIFAILLGYKKPVLVPIPKNNNNQKKA